MSYNKPIKSIVINDLQPVLNELSKSDMQALQQMQSELVDNWNKKQIFRTEVEMRTGVLNDLKFPTNAAKYWQCVREMSSMFDGLMEASFDFRENEVHILKTKKKLEKAKNKQKELKILELQIELDRLLYRRACIRQTASDRVRELKLWSQLKDELDDGSFDTTTINSKDQFEAHRIMWHNRTKVLNENSQPADVANALGSHIAAEKIAGEDGKMLDFKQTAEKLKKLEGDQTKQIDQGD